MLYFKNLSALRSFVLAFISLALTVIFLVTSSSALAASDKATHASIHLTPDKSEIIRLDRPAARVILGNEQHLSIFIDAPDRIVLVPRTPGATFFTVLSEEGDVIMQRHAIIGSPQANYLRVRNSCNSSSGECQNTQVYYCPDMCHQIALPSADAPSASQDLEGLQPLPSTASNTSAYQELP